MLYFVKLFLYFYLWIPIFPINFIPKVDGHTVIKNMHGSEEMCS